MTAWTVQGAQRSAEVRFLLAQGQYGDIQASGDRPLICLPRSPVTESELVARFGQALHGSVSW